MRLGGTEDVRRKDADSHGGPGPPSTAPYRKYAWGDGHKPRYTFLFLIICAIALGVGITLISYSPPVALPGVAGKWQPTWDDEFNGPVNRVPDPDKWVHDVGGSWGKHELQYYTDSRRNAFQDGHGHLVIVAREEKIKGHRCWKEPCQYTSGRLKTQGKFTQQYGYFESRIQVPHGQGIWPAFWMLGDNIDSVGCPACGEIDVMENIGSEPGTVYGSAHGPPNGPGSQVSSYQLGDGRPLSDGFHTFGVEWAPDSLSWYIDGKKYATYTKAQTAPKSWVYDQPFFLLLNVAVGGQWPGDPDSSTEFPQSMLVDYVRVYERAS